MNINSQLNTCARFQRLILISLPAPCGLLQFWYAAEAYEATRVESNRAVVSILGVVLKFHDHIPRTRIPFRSKTQLPLDRDAYAATPDQFESISWGEERLVHKG